MADVRRSTTTDTQETSLNCYEYLRDDLSAEEVQVVWLFRQLSAQDQERLIEQLRQGVIKLHN
ncbi:hypothetical protein N9B31_10345 [Mariniblastus sp.]|nr:hypothetical protein [Mariniblastus sp.]MDA7924724.1 hypothetical protein [Mariniblastus sp.]